MGCATSDLDRHWPDAIVPYDASTAPHTQDGIKKAIAFYEKWTPFRFVKRNGQEDHLYFTETENRDIDPGDPVAKGNWKSIRTGHQLMVLKDHWVMDWKTAANSTDVRIWRMDFAGNDPFVDPALNSHTWHSINSQDELVSLGNDLVMAWRPGTGGYRVWKIDRHVSSTGDPLPTSVPPGAANSGKFTGIGSGHKLYALNGGYLLDWQASGKYRVFKVEDAASKFFPFNEAAPVIDRSWSSINLSHRIIPFPSSDRVLDWDPASGQVRLWRMDPNNAGDLLPGPVLWSGTWSWLDQSDVLLPLDSVRLLVWRPSSGDFAIRFLNTDTSHSGQIGRQGGRNTVYIQPGTNAFTLLHEIGHALGLYHEQQRPDWLGNVMIITQNIADGESGNFTTQSEDEVLMVTPYDCASIMHYDRTAYSKNGAPTIVGLLYNDPLIGLESMPSADDVATLNAVADPLSGPTTGGTWKTIKDDKQMVTLIDHVIVWDKAGVYTVWHYDDKARNTDPLPKAAASGGWKVIDKDHRLIHVGDNYVFDWKPDDGHFRLYRFDPNLYAGHQDPLPEPPLRSGTWKTITDDHRIVGLGGGRVLVWDDDRNFRVYRFDPKAADPLVEPPLTSGRWKHIDADHELTLLPDGNVLDRKDADYWIWQQDAAAKGSDDPLPRLLARGRWKTIDDDHRMYCIKGQLLDWQPDSGKYRVWSYGGRFGAFNPDPFPGSPRWAGKSSPLLKNCKAIELDPQQVLVWDSVSGKYQVLRINIGAAAGSDALVKVTSGSFGVKGDQQLVNVGGKRLLHFDPPTGTAKVFDYVVDPAKPLLSAAAVTTHPWATIKTGHQLSSLGNGLVLDAAPGGAKSSFRVWRYDPAATGTADPLPGMLASTDSATLVDSHTTVKISPAYAGGPEYVIDWVFNAGYYRVLLFDRAKPGNFLHGAALQEGRWKTIAVGHHMATLSGGMVLEWDESNGSYRIWDFAAQDLQP